MAADNSGVRRNARKDEIAAGSVLGQALYTRAGRLVAHEGTVLTDELATHLQEASAAGAEFRMDDRVPAVDGQRAPAVGPRAIRGMPDPGHQGGVPMSELRRSAPALVAAARGRWEKLPLSVDVGVDPVTVRRGRDGAETTPGEVERSLLLRRQAGVKALRQILGKLIDGHRVRCAELVVIADDLLDAVDRHAGVYAIPALGLPRPVDSLPDHAYSTAALAIGMSAALGWPRADVRMVGVAGLLCDAGMGLVSQPIRRAARPLTDVEINAARRHPEYGVVLARQIDGLPERVVLAVYQHHERGDGSGYPEGARAERLHDYARVLGVADAFAGMTSPRAHRPAMTAHAALSELAQSTEGAASNLAGSMDRAAVRALLDVLGLYPPGSFVRLSSGHVAMVGATAPREAPDRPVVHVVQPRGAAERFGRPIDLARIEPKLLRVLEAVRPPEGVMV